MFFGLLLLLVVLGGLLLSVIALIIAITFWRNQVVRYTLIGVCGLATLPLIWWWTYDPNNSAEARSWQGEYHAQCLIEGRLTLSDDQTFELNSLSFKPPLTGTWSWINSEDWNYVELHLSSGYVVQLFGQPTHARTDYLPVGSEVMPCTFTKI